MCILYVYIYYYNEYFSVRYNFCVCFRRRRSSLGLYTDVCVYAIAWAQSALSFSRRIMIMIYAAHF